MSHRSPPYARHVTNRANGMIAANSSGLHAHSARDVGAERADLD